MKFIKPFLVFVFFVALSAVILSLLLPAKQKLEKSVTIQAPAAVIYEQLSKLENFNKWSVWSQQDSSTEYTLTGADGTVGAATAWTGDPALSGEGKMEIMALEPGQKISHSIRFKKPKKAKATSVFSLKEANGATTVTWNFEMATPRPWNIFNLFYSMDKQMGRDFEKGLVALKQLTEASTGKAPAESFAVHPMDFPATTFAVIRQEVKWPDITAFLSQHLPILYEEAAKNNISAGAATGLYFVWDEKNQQADMAAAIPVSAGTKMPHSIIRITGVDGSKAVYVNYTGAYDKMADAHMRLDKYLADNGLTQKQPVVEQYIYGPANEKDTAKWLTKIVYLVE